MAIRDDIQAQNIPMEFNPDDPESVKKLYEVIKQIAYKINDQEDRLSKIEIIVNG